jgi:hypothetical protein
MTSVEIRDLTDQGLIILRSQWNHPKRSGNGKRLRFVRAFQDVSWEVFHTY